MLFHEKTAVSVSGAGAAGLVCIVSVSVLFRPYLADFDHQSPPIIPCLSRLCSYVLAVLECCMLPSVHCGIDRLQIAAFDIFLIHAIIKCHTRTNLYAKLLHAGSQRDFIVGVMVR